MLLCMLFSVATSSCSKDDKDEPANPSSNSIVGTWVNDDSEVDYSDIYTLVFNSDHTGYIRNDYGSRSSHTTQMNFDWSLTTTSSGQYRLAVIYKSGDRYMDGPFGDGYAQYECLVTIAGSTLSIQTGDNTVMLFRRSK